MRRAARALGGAGEPRDARALASLLADEAPLVREAALEAIARLGHDAPEVAAALAGVLRDPEHGRLAARALGRARDAARSGAVEALARVPGDAPAAVQLEAALARLHLGGSSPGLALRILDHAVAVDPASDDEERVVDALVALGRADPEARLALARALEDEARAALAAAAIVQLGPLAADAAPVLRRCASEHHTSAARRLVYADALHAVSGDAGPLVALLGSVLEPSDERATRREALDRLARLGPAGLGALEPLLGALRDPELRTAALAALAAIGPGAAAAAPRVRPLLAHPEARFRAEAALTLGALGTWSSELEELAERDESGRVRLAARLALRRLGR